MITIAWRINYHVDFDLYKWKNAKIKFTDIQVTWFKHIHQSYQYHIKNLEITLRL